MKAIAVYPGTPDSLHLEDVPKPKVSDIPGGRGVLVQVVRVGACGTDKEINEAKYGQAPEGSRYLIIGHENLGRVVEVGPNVPATLAPGTYVVATVRRPGNSVYDQIGLQDMTTDNTYYERGINLRHGYLAEYYVEDAAYLVPLPDSLREVGVLLEPLSVSEKGINQTFEIQRRLKVWEPQRAAVLGAGPIGLLAALALRLRGMEVVCYSRKKPPNLKADLIEEIGHSPLIFEAAADALAANGVLVLESVTGGETTAQIPADRINQGFVLGNKVMFGTVNASHADFVSGVNDLLAAEATYPGWLAKLLTTPVRGLENYADMVRNLNENADAIKIFIDVLPTQQQHQH